MHLTVQRQPEKHLVWRATAAKVVQTSAPKYEQAAGQHSSLIFSTGLFSPPFVPLCKVETTTIVPFILRHVQTLAACRCLKRHAVECT